MFVSRWYKFCGTSLLLVLCGCTSPSSRPSPLYPVLWHEKGEGILVRSENEWSFPQEVVRVKRGSIAAIPLHLVILNGTGRDLFVERLEENPGLTVKWRTNTVTSSESFEHNGFGSGWGLGGYGGTYDLLEARDWCSGKSFPINGIIMLDVRAKISLMDAYEAEDVKYTEVEIEFPFVYYALGATEPATIFIKRSMRVEYED